MVTTQINLNCLTWKNDSTEQVNLAKEYPKIVATMSHQIDEWWQPAD